MSIRKPPSKTTRRLKAAAFVLLAVLAVAVFAAMASGYGPDEARALLQEEKPKKPVKVSLLEQPPAATLQAPTASPLPLTNAAYRTISADYETISLDNFAYARQSVFDPTWASVRAYAPDGSGYHVVFLRKNGDSWVPDRSVFMGEFTDERYLKPLLQPVPGDLASMVPSTPQLSGDGDAKKYAATAMERATGQDGWSATSEKNEGSRHVVEVANDREDEKDLRTKVYLTGKDGLWNINAIGRDLSSTEVPDFPEKFAEQARLDSPRSASHGSSEAVVDDVEREKIEDGLSKVEQEVEDYPGVAGFYVHDLEGGFGYGVRPDEEFFAASVIKVPVMVGVFREVEAGKLSFDETLTIQEEDIAPGSGGLEYQDPGTEQTVGDLLWLMITESDNTATNVLVRAVGGEDRVNEVSRSLGATDTVLRQKVTVERAAVPALDNQTTPADMAEILTKIYQGKAASEKSCKQMIELMSNTRRETWLEDGLPSDAKVANKAGWLDSTFNDVAIVEHDGRPYVVSAFTKYGKNDYYRGEAFLNELSSKVHDLESSDGLDNQ